MATLDEQFLREWLAQPGQIKLKRIVLRMLNENERLQAAAKQDGERIDALMKTVRELFLAAPTPSH